MIKYNLEVLVACFYFFCYCLKSDEITMDQFFLNEANMTIIHTRIQDRILSSSLYLLTI